MQSVLASARDPWVASGGRTRLPWSLATDSPHPTTHDSGRSTCSPRRAARPSAARSNLAVPTIYYGGSAGPPPAPPPARPPDRAGEGWGARRGLQGSRPGSGGRVGAVRCGRRNECGAPATPRAPRGEIPLRFFTPTRGSAGPLSVAGGFAPLLPTARRSCPPIPQRSRRVNRRSLADLAPAQRALRRSDLAGEWVVGETRAEVGRLKPRWGEGAV